MRQQEIQQQQQDHYETLYIVKYLRTLDRIQ